MTQESDAARQIQALGRGALARNNEAGRIRQGRRARSASNRWKTENVKAQRRLAALREDMAHIPEKSAALRGSALMDSLFARFHTEYIHPADLEAMKHCRDKRSEFEVR